MTNSTFWIDGFSDGRNGLQASPPSPYSFAGNTTTVFAAEYLAGWMEGRKERQEALHSATEVQS